MSGTAAPVTRPRAVELLESGVACLVPLLERVTPADLGRCTPCRDWDVATLLLHLAEGVDTLTTCLPDEYACEDPGPLRSVTELGERCGRMLDAWSVAGHSGSPEAQCSWDGVMLPHRMVALVGALELAVHAWDVARAIEEPPMAAEALATDLLPWAPRLFPESSAFATPRPWSADAPALERLVAATGRDPRWSPRHPDSSAIAAREDRHHT